MPLVVCVALLNILLGLLPLVFIVTMSLLLNRLPLAQNGPSGQPRWDQLVTALAFAAAAFILQQLLSPYRSAAGDLVARRIDGYCVGRLMSAALAEAPIDALEQSKTLELLSDARGAFQRQAPTPGDAGAGLLALVSRYAQLLGACLLVGWALSGWAGLLVAATALLVRFGQRGSLGRFAGLWGRLRGDRRKVAYLRDIGSGAEAAKEIRVLGLIQWIQKRHRQETDAYLAKLWEGRRKLLFLPFVWLALVGLAGGSASLLVLAGSAEHGRLTLLELAIAVQSILIPVRFGVYFPECDVQTQYGMQAFEALCQFEQLAAEARPLEAAPPRAKGRPESPDAAPVPKVAIRFEDVGFRYSAEGPQVLHHLDLHIEAGKSTAVVGLNGAGKTTLVKLLTRLHTPTVGRITVDGIDLAEMDATAWQRRFAVIFQDFVRYELTMDENIAMGAPHLAGAEREAALDAAAQRADIDGLRLSLGSAGDTVLSRQYTGGTDLSGGQWQRVALARAFYAVEAGARVLVLDEPTAQLDVRAEARFFDRFLELTTDLTTIVISHRFSTVRRADRIVVLEDGAVREQGTHDELVALGGRYAELFRLQAQRFADDSDRQPLEARS